MKTYICKEPVELSRKEFDKINKLFKINFEEKSPKTEALVGELDARPEKIYCTFWWDFEDVTTIQIDILSNKSYYFGDVGIIRDEEDTWLEHIYLLKEEMKFVSFDGENEYVCKIKIID